MNYGTLKIAGWLAMTSAFVSIPLTWLSFRLERSSDPGVDAVQIGIQLAGSLLFVAIILLLRRMLNRRFSFHDTDRSIDLMVVANLAASLLAILALFLPAQQEALSLGALAGVVVQGALQIRFGFLLLRLQDDLDGMLRHFCYLNMATGVCIASVVLLLFGVVVSSIADLMLGTIFFHIARQVREQENRRKSARP